MKIDVVVTIIEKLTQQYLRYMDVEDFGKAATVRNEITRWQEMIDSLAAKQKNG